MSWVAVGIGVAAAAGGGAAYLGAGKKPKVPQIPRIDLDSIQQSTISGNEAAFSRTKTLASNINRFNQQELLRALEFSIPGGLKKSQDLISSQLDGKLDLQDTQALIRNATAANFGSGIQGMPLGRNLSLRDIGRAGVDQRERGFRNFSTLASITKSPLFDASSMFFTPAQRLQQANEDRRMNFDREMAVSAIEAQPSPTAKALSAFLGIGGSLIGSYATGGAGGMMGGGGGGGSSSSGYSYPSGWGAPQGQSGSVNTSNRFSFDGTQYGGGWR